MTLAVDLRGMLELESFLEDAPDITRRAASISINDTLEGSGLAQYRRGISEQINVPASYLNDDRLGVTQRATPTRLEARVVGRQRPTSLARFATSGAVGSKGGVSVRVKAAGGSKFLPGGFLVRLRSGAGLTDDNFNVGLAVRLKPGQQLNKKDQSRMVRLDANVVLLYGPSIDQVLRNDVAERVTPGVTSDIATEFFRQFARLSHA